MGANEMKGYVFDAGSVPPLFFFNSPASHWRVCESKLDIQKPNEISQDAKQCFEAVLDSLAKKRFSSLDDLIKWNAYFLFAQFFIGQGDLDRAIEFALKAKEVGLSYSIEYKNLATLYSEKGNLAQAKAYAEKALEINPQMPERNAMEDIIKKAKANIPGNLKL
jgi:tetratricopeptide (TPR) repeat protein